MAARLAIVAQSQELLVHGDLVAVGCINERHRCRISTFLEEPFAPDVPNPNGALRYPRAKLTSARLRLFDERRTNTSTFGAWVDRQVVDFALVPLDLLDFNSTQNLTVVIATNDVAIVLKDLR